MDFKTFISEYDKEGFIVLLEGKRDVKEEDKDKLTSLGKLLSTHTQHMIFRSGNAPGADEYFSEGVTSLDKKRLQVVVPYSGHRQRTNSAGETFALDEMDIASDPEILLQSKMNKKTEKLVDKYAEGGRDRFSMKAAYIIRDTIKALGTSTLAPANLGIFYDDLENPMSGGTGHTMNVCLQNNIPVIDQKTWMKWLEE